MKLLKIKLADKVIYEQKIDLPTATINSGWKGNPKDRTTDPGKAKDLVLEYEKTADTTGPLSCTSGFKPQVLTIDL